LVKKITFKIKHLLYHVDGQTGEIKEYPTSLLGRYYGREFTGSTIYQGKFPDKVRTVEMPLLFMTPDEALTALGYSDDQVPPHKRNALKTFSLIRSKDIECFIIASRPNPSFE
jgi:hypothetical protein